MLIKRGLLLAAAGLLTVSQAQDVRDIKPAASRGTRTVATRPAVMYPESAREYYMTQDELDYIRPGFNIKVNSITIPADNRPLADVSFSDDFDQPLDRLGKVTPGPLSVSFILAWWDPIERHYTAYTTRIQTALPPSPTPGVQAIQAAVDSGGTFTDLGLGHATYKFKTVLPASYDKTKTHTLGIYATRNMAGIQDKNYYANVVLPFRPDGGAVTDVWDKTTTATCNNCHNPLALHGGARREVGLCVLCHQPQTTDPDTGNTVDFKVMVHKIHMGENLPSVKAGTPYQIIGFNQIIFDASTIALPQDIRNCAKCHAAPATQAPNWYSFPSRAACGSCHDGVNFVTGDDHPGGPQADDTQCASCHAPQGDREWDASIKGAHTVPFKSTQLKGINATILSVTNTAPGQKPTIKFQLKQNDGTPINPATFGASIAVLMGGPTTDYAVNPNNFRERADGASFDGTTATYTFTHAVPADGKGTWAFALEARRTITLDPAPMDPPATVNESAFNPVYYAAVTDSAPVPRRKAVDLANCNKCHDQLALHGSFRRNTEMCVICHNPNEDDSAYRPAAKNPPESVDMKRMIHRIHSGEELAQDYTVYGFGGSVNNFNEVRFPGDRRDCQKCHVPGAYQVAEDDALATRIPTITLRDWYSPMQPVAAACLGCHSEKHQAAHAFVMTAPFGEACGACHSPDAEFAVDKVHAR